MGISDMVICCCDRAYSVCNALSMLFIIMSRMCKDIISTDSVVEGLFSLSLLKSFDL